MTKLACEEAEKVGALRVENDRLRAALQEVMDAPCSMVNDSESLRHTIKGMQHTAREALRRNSH